MKDVAGNTAFRPGVEERHAAILRALGEGQAREETALDLIPGLVGSPIYCDG